MTLGRVFRGVGWAAVGAWSQALIGAATLIVMARLLGPDPYGLYGLAFLIISVTTVIVGGPLAEAVTQEQSYDPTFASATFWGSLVLSAVLWVLLVVAATPLAAAFDSPRLVGILPIFGGYAVMNAAGSAPTALLVRRFHFDRLSQVQTLASVVASVVGIVCAARGYGVWSLVAMEMTRAALRSVGVFLVSGFRPGWRPQVRLWPGVIMRNWGAVVTNSFGYLNAHLPRAVIVVILGERALGLYVIATRLYAQASNLLFGPMGAVAMSAVARNQSDPLALRRLILGGISVASALSAPAFVGLAAIAPTLVPFAFGDQFTGAVIAAQIMLLVGTRAAIGTFNIAIVRGMGRHASPAALSAAGVVIIAALAPWAAHYGVAAVAAVVLFRHWSLWPVSAWTVKTATGVGVGDQARAAAAPLIAAGLMGLIVYALQFALHEVMGSSATLAISVAAGVVLYGGFVLVLRPDLARALQELLRRALRREPIDWRSVIGGFDPVK